MMKSITEAGNLKGKRVLVRVDWSVPTQNGEVMNDYQIQKSLPTIEYLREAGAKITLISHAERDTDSLEPIYKHVKEFLPALTFVKPSNLVLLENLRQNKGEKENSKEFAKELANLGDIFVNEAFPVSHRAHASVVGVPELLPSFAGLQLTLEVETLSKAFYPKRPFLFILGGAKFDTKLPLLKKFVNIADYIFVGGALAHNFFKELGRDIGDSLVSNGDFGLKELLNTGKIILPDDTIVEDKKIMDAGPVTMENLKSRIRSSQLVLWNGPLGSYERGYRTATLQLAKLIAESGRESIIGGGDTLSAVKELDLFDKFSFVSTGGGAMLEFLATGTLPGIEALSKKQ